MEDLQAALQSVLSDPQQMEQVLAMANALGLHPPGAEETQQTCFPPAESSAFSSESQTADERSPLTDPAVLRLIGALGNLQGPEDQVLNTLRPVVRDPRRIDRALRAARLSRLAGQLLKKGAEHV